MENPGVDLAFLDWPELLERLAAQAQSARGQAACRALTLAATAAEAEARMADVAEAVALQQAGESLPSLTFPEVEHHLDAVEKGVPLSAEELKQVAGQCEVALSVRRWFGRLDPGGEDGPVDSAQNPERVPHLPRRATSGEALLRPRALGGPKAPRLHALAAGLSGQEEIVFHARDTFDPSGELRDTASPELFRLRRERDQIATRVRGEAERLLRSEAYAPYLQDEYVTLREDRFVLPLKASFKSMGLGIVHDTSRSGETVFLEPTAMVELNNRLKVAEIEIRRESRRILEELAALIAGAAPSLRADREVLTRLDVVFAAARLAVAYEGTPVAIVAEPIVDLRALRHPLLALPTGTKRPAVVANDLALGEIRGVSEAKVLVVSGPNAGGKTVLLKAVGLAALSARAGLLLPAAPGSRIGFFDGVYADIGDQQSVVSDLSTFSAHLANLARIIQAVEGAGPAHLLVLCDELMAGTHPEQGAALARATLENLANGPALVITTTHYDSLKALTEGDRRFRNAGMEYDLQNLRPTFRLRDGLPGRSYALDIAARMGLPAPVLARAQELLGASSLGLENVLRDLEQREEALTRAERALDQAREALEARTEEEKAAAQALARRERELGLRTRELLDQAVREARDAIGAVVREVKSQRSLSAAAAARQKVEEAAEKARVGLPEPAPLALEVDKLREALAARALGVTGKGSRPKDRSAGASPSPEPAVPVAVQTRANSVDVRGQRADEALRQLEAFLDQAALDGTDSIFVIHGHGTGALRRAVREYLANSPYVERFRPGGPGEGGDGVSVVSVRG
jgi:DNA mismatch repair protein MutS2